MGLIKEYKIYVKWCRGSNAIPIGFVPWKELKLNCKFNERTGVWIKNK